MQHNTARSDLHRGAMIGMSGSSLFRLGVPCLMLAVMHVHAANPVRPESVEDWSRAGPADRRLRICLQQHFHLPELLRRL